MWRVESGRVGSGQEVFEISRDGSRGIQISWAPNPTRERWPDSTRPVRSDPTRPVKSLGAFVPVRGWGKLGARCGWPSCVRLLLLVAYFHGLPRSVKIDPWEGDPTRPDPCIALG